MEISVSHFILFYGQNIRTLNDLTRKIVPISEIWTFQQDALQQFNNGD